MVVCGWESMVWQLDCADDRPHEQQGGKEWRADGGNASSAIGNYFYE